MQREILSCSSLLLVARIARASVLARGLKLMVTTNLLKCDIDESRSWMVSEEFEKKFKFVLIGCCRYCFETEASIYEKIAVQEPR